MTQRITVGFVGADYATLSLAIASIPTGVPFAQPVVIEVHASTPTQAITIPSNILPTAANPLIIMSLRSDPVFTPFPPFQSVIGSLAQYPAPQPRLVKAVMSSFDIRSNYTQVDAFQVDGDVTVTANTGVVVNACLVEQGQVLVSRLAPTPVDVQLSNIEVHRSGQKSAILANNVQGLKIYHNTLLQRRQDASVVIQPTYALEVAGSDVDVRNNIFAADGIGRFAVRFIGNPAASAFQHNFYTSFGGALRFSYGPDSLTVTETDDKNLWAGFMTSETGGVVGDPEFRDRQHATTLDLDVSNTSPAMAVAPALMDVRHDIRGERRPYDYVTAGAHDHAEVIVYDGRTRFLELISGLSVDPVTKCVLGKSGDTSLFNDFPAQLADDNDLDEIFQPIPIEDIEVPGAPQDGLIIFRPAFQVTEPIYGQILDPVFDMADEVGLVATDNKVFMIKRMHKIPFDACGFMFTDFQIPVEIVG